MTRSADDILTVSELTQEIQEVLEGRIGSVWVEGEISNHRLQSSGHQYFTLKDAGAQISCVLFRGAASRLGAKMADGVQVQVLGELGVYAPRGQYQLVVRDARLQGMGGLQAKFEALKRRLYEEGLFDETLKKPIPAMPNVVALVTSPTGAAVQDMLNILGRRAPWLHVIIFPVRVQGIGVEKETIEALRILNQSAAMGLPKPDVIVMGRGGGSLEDLWAYNEESLARAVRASAIPVISAVGHEIDFTIADFVADLRAPTPSAAAELLAPDVEELKRRASSIAQRMRRQVEAKLAHDVKVVELLKAGGLRHAMGRRLELEQQHVDEIESCLKQAFSDKMDEVTIMLGQIEQRLLLRQPHYLIRERQHELAALGQALSQAMRRRFEALQAKLEGKVALLQRLGPDSVLSRGFTYVTDVTGLPVTRAEGVEEGRKILIHFHDGLLAAEVANSEMH